MIRKIATVGLLTLTMALPFSQANAQDPALGGAIAGGVIGAVLGASIASQMEPRRSGYYYYQDDCWRRRADGSYVRTYRRYCG